MTTVLIVDDHRTFAELLAHSLDSEPDLVCVGLAGNVADALAMTAAKHPDVVLMDIGLPDGDGVAATQRITELHPNVRVVVLTAHSDPLLFGRAVRAGARGFLAKDGALAEVLMALRAARHGSLLVGSDVLTSFASAQAEHQARRDAPGLTAREERVLQLLADGQDVRAIAKAMGISVNTCRGHVRSLREKLGARSQLEAVVVAVRTGLLAAAGPARPQRPGEGAPWLPA